MSEIQIPEAEWVEFETLVTAHLDNGLWRFEKEMRVFVERSRWDWMPHRDKKRFRFWARVIFQQANRRQHELRRRAQLRDAGFALWIMQGYDHTCCPVEHREINGIVLPSGHPFWGEYLPPNDWNCTCYVSGARNEAGARRLNGDPSLSLPPWWREQRGINLCFRSNGLPDLREVIELLHCGHFK